MAEKKGAARVGSPEQHWSCTGCGWEPLPGAHQALAGPLLSAQGCLAWGEPRSGSASSIHVTLLWTWDPILILLSFLLCCLWIRCHPLASPPKAQAGPICGPLRGGSGMKLMRFLLRDPRTSPRATDPSLDSAAGPSARTWDSSHSLSSIPRYNRLQVLPGGTCVGCSPFYVHHSLSGRAQVCENEIMTGINFSPLKSHYLKSNLFPIWHISSTITHTGIANLQPLEVDI